MNVVYLLNQGLRTSYIIQIFKLDCDKFNSVITKMSISTWNSYCVGHTESLCWIHNRGSVMNIHHDGYTNTNQSSRSCVLYYQTVQCIPFRILYFIRNIDTWYCDLSLSDLLSLLKLIIESDINSSTWTSPLTK